MKEIKSIDRSFQNQKNEVIETDVAKSGFNLSYRNHLGGLVLGRLYPQSIQHLMPNDKISGNNEASITFEQLSTPVVDTMDVCVHNFLVTLRSIDNRWEKFMTPTKLNNMNVNVSVPTFSLKAIIQSIVLFLSALFDIVLKDNDPTNVVEVDPTVISNTYSPKWNFVYHSDALLDLRDQLLSILGSKYDPDNGTFLDLEVTDDVTMFKEIVCCVLDFFVGKRSLLDYFGYRFLDRSEIMSSLDNMFENGSLPADIGENSLTYWFTQDISSIFIADYTLQNEYALRAYYAIWFEYYRNYDLEPRSLTLPEYHDFGASSIFGTIDLADGSYNFNNLHYLVPRIRSWQQDAFTTAGIDDISRHVFAPVLESNYYVKNVSDDSLQPSGVLDNNTINQELSWRNPATGVVSNLVVPMPSRLLSLFTPSDDSGLVSDYAVELFSLRKAQMLENYLKRIYYGGDEYRDRMLHLYGARIEDYRINRPQWLSSSLDKVDPKQEVANTGVAPGSPTGWSAGSRLATATAVQAGNDGFTEFCPEFGVYISILSIMPHATYDPMLLQNMQTKYTDFPIPQFANQMEDVISAVEISRRVPHSAFGYAPYAHAYRYRVDEVHGDYHDSKYDYVFFRYFDASSVPNLSWSFLHCRPKLPMFVNSVLLDGQAYGTFKHNFLVERPLPSPVETI